MSDKQVSEDWPAWCRFLVVGALGFVVDAGILSIGVHLLGMSVWYARAVSFGMAVIVTWWGNRHFSFAQRVESSRGLEFVRYMVVSLCGVGVNWLVFTLCMLGVPLAADYPVLALIPAALLAAGFNYHGSARWVFRAAG